MTESNRKLHIARALTQYEQAAGERETYPIPLRGQTMLPVIDIPLEVPVLNPDSFRIAPQLEDHPKCDLVRSDPFSTEAQEVIAELVAQVHRHTLALKENLADEGQVHPGLITRDGKLINGNTRCVLLRQLAREGKTQGSTIRVAVLPSGVLANRELLEIEMVLQQQQELKDQYRLANHLMMIKRLHAAGLSDEAIAGKLRFRKSGGQTGGQKVKERREVLRLMERARKLSDPPLPISAFASERDQYQNWQELLKRTKQLDVERGTSAGDDHIRRWLIAYLSGINSVHKLRYATGNWIEDNVLDDISRNGELRAVVTTAAKSKLSANSHDADEPSGLDLLGGEETSTSEEKIGAEVHALLDVVAKAHQASKDGEVELADGNKVSVPEVLTGVAGTVKKALDIEKRKSDAGNRLTRPQGHLRTARTALSDAIRALEDVRIETEFSAYSAAVTSLAREVIEAASKVLSLVDGAAVQESILTREEIDQ